MIANVAANLFGRAWIALMGFVFVPLYIRFLGIEAYGLIGFFTSLMAIFAVLDLGLSITINREFARMDDAGEAHAPALLRTLELVYWVTALGLAIALILAAPAIARDWLEVRSLPIDDVVLAIRLMGVVALFRWPVALYTGALLGLGNQIRLNLIVAAGATLQSAGAALVLWLAAPTIVAFFTWQAAAAALLVMALIAATWHRWDARSRLLPPRFATMRGLVRFSAGVAGIALLSVVLTQLDKLLLSRMLPLAEFGHYALASAIVALLGTPAAAVHAAAFPVLSRLAHEGEPVALAHAYHRASQLAALIVVPAALTLILFARPLLLVYLGDPALADAVAPLLSLLAAGTGLLAIMLMPLALQLAHGWTSLSLWKNVLAVALFVPTLIFAVERLGARGAALTWLALTLGYVLIEVSVMHRRLLPDQKWRWYLVDLVLPVAVGLAVLLPLRLLMPHTAAPLAQVALIAVAAAAALVLTAAAMPLTRAQLLTLRARMQRRLA